MRSSREFYENDERRDVWRVVIHEGRNRQIRRTFEALGYRVLKLHRVQFGRYQLAGLKLGTWEKIEKI